MSDDQEFPPEEIWDEYTWERFLQKQDSNTEKYFQLFETYIDHPDRDEIIAEEMGWSVFESAVEEQEEVEEFLGEAMEFLTDSEQKEYDEEFDEFTTLPPMRTPFAFIAG